MKYHKPSFFDQFKCIGSACTDTCCAGWEIEVDETTAEGYLTEKGAFGDRLRREIGSEPGEYFFKLQDNRCPFLNKENLCDIFINLGEDRLCDICREHPRFYNWFGDYTEVGLGLCCEEAERLLFSDSKPLTFVEEVTQDEDDELSEEMWHEAEDETEDVCQSVSEEQDDSDENEHTDDFDQRKACWKRPCRESAELHTIHCSGSAKSRPTGTIPKAEPAFSSVFSRSSPANGT